MDRELEVIDEFIDGQRVDASALKSALASPDGRDYFVDTWLLREAVHEDGVAATPTLRPHPHVSRSWILAAAIAGVAAGFSIGYIAGVPAGAPPSPQPRATAEASPGVAFPAPAPTRVIQLEFQHAPGASGGN